MNNLMVNEAVSTLQRRYAYALDRREMEVWLECFATDGSYLCQTKENFDEGLSIGFMLDDCYARLQDRVKAIEEVWAGTAEEYQSRHMVSPIHIGEPADGMVEAVSNFVVFYTTNRGHSSILATGEYRDVIRVSGETAQFKSRKAILDQSVIPRYIVYPI